LIVERTDFIAVPATDMERSRRFYAETVGLPPVGDGQGWPEFQLGENVSLYLIDPTNIGQAFEGPHTAHIALRVPDVDEARAELESRGVEFDRETVDTGDAARD
jgi:catechol 2,3-dioxygenase-like lactoylglutathione lyase family enzyme